MYLENIYATVSLLILFTEPVTSLGTGNGNIFELILHVHDPAKDKLSPVSAEGNYGHGIDNCKYCLLIMRTFWVANERTMNFSRS
jgi:hypothetical protein